ncbi:serine hydrolase domain-containing protein [Actinocatenispora rupis]|uniref:Esterase n=1 Tax=Actinocatenispora rupis TaxID=519421 RepID=A0A8J3NGU2_9ACTN|nr:serine hydrolase domain-containing protein [Actinocatenispora rupis]GID15209.1 esterase [Actinocatenispora rupis]
MHTTGYDGLAALLAAGRTARLYSGAAWSVGTADGPLDRGTLGTLAWDGPPVTADTRWDLASVTKPLVALAVLALLERGALGLDDPVGDHLPEYAGGEHAGVTVGRLLTHTSGLPGRQPLYRLHRTRPDLLAAVRALPLRTPPGTAVEYSSAGFVVLGLVAEAASGLGLADLVAATVTGPAAMTDTGFVPPAADRERCAATEDCPWRGHVVQGSVHDENAEVLGGVAGHAGLFGPHTDLERLGIALLRNGSGDRGRLLSPRTVAVAGASHTDGLTMRRGLGWQCRDAHGSPAGDLFTADSYGHTGFTGTSLWIDPTLGRYAVLLTNRVHPSRDTPGFDRLRARFHTMAAIHPG